MASRLSLPLSSLEAVLVPLAQSLEAGVTLLEHANGPAGRLVPLSVRRAFDSGAREGLAISEIFARLGILSAASLGLLKAAESRGEPAVALRAIAARVAEERKDLRRIAAGLTYPLFLVLSTILIGPLPRVVSEGVGSYVATVTGPLLLFSVAVAAAIFVVPRLHPDGPVLRLVRWALRLFPPLAYASRHRALATFADVLGASVAAGLSFRESIPLACDAAAHPTLSGRAERVMGRIAAGATLADAMSSELALPEKFAALVAHGERVGKLDEILPRLSSEHAERARAAVAATVVLTLLLASVATMGYVAHEVASGWSRVSEGLLEPLEGLKGIEGLEGLF
ncbi:MAG: type II secretion system F family protein [Deltaproteobacteria bacterium]|nr:type II secretion system F family protein [Deltaproteobacteria bacterium]